MRAGLLRHRISVQSADSAFERSGQPTQAWKTEKRVWASIRPLRGEERFEAQKVAAQVTHAIRMRHDASLNLTSKNRLLFGTRIFHIESVANLEERDQVLDVLCREEV